MSLQQQNKLRQFGIQLPLNQIQQATKYIKNHQIYKQQYQKIKQKIYNEDQFIERIIRQHSKIAEISQNSKVIQIRENTYQIRAINPQQITSLTERAFFNSFNLQRIVPNDYERPQKIFPSSKKKDFPQAGVGGGRKINFQEQQKCICGKIDDKLPMVQCLSQTKCRGSNWYHMSCVGFDDKNLDEMAEKQFLCDLCKRNQEKSSNESQKKVKKQ